MRERTQNGKMFLKYSFLIATSMALTACSIGERTGVPYSQAPLPSTERLQIAAEVPARQNTLLVVNAWARGNKGSLAAYRTPSGAPTQQFNLNVPWAITSGGGYVYVSNYANQNISIFRTGRTGQVDFVRTIPVRKPTLIASDRSGNLYVDSATSKVGQILFFPVGSSKPTRTITSGISGPITIACDSYGDLFVLNFEFSPSISVFAPTSSVPKLTITKGLHDPETIALDAVGNLYVANLGYNATGTVAVYLRGKRTPKRFIRTGISQPVALAFDKGGDLYVANQLNYTTTRSSITAYAPGASTPMLTIDGSGCPTGDCIVNSLAFDSAGRLYVPNLPVNQPSVTGQVSVFLPGQTTLWRAITTGVDGPTALLVVQ
jgi:hypothetical protein